MLSVGSPGPGRGPAAAGSPPPARPFKFDRLGRQSDSTWSLRGDPDVQVGAPRTRMLRVGRTQRACQGPGLLDRPGQRSPSRPGPCLEALDSRPSQGRLDLTGPARLLGSLPGRLGTVTVPAERRPRTRMRADPAPPLNLLERGLGPPAQARAPVPERGDGPGRTSRAPIPPRAVHRRRSRADPPPPAPTRPRPRPARDCSAGSRLGVA